MKKIISWNTFTLCTMFLASPLGHAAHVSNQPPSVWGTDKDCPSLQEVHGLKATAKAAHKESLAWQAKADTQGEGIVYLSTELENAPAYQQETARIEKIRELAWNTSNDAGKLNYEAFKLDPRIDPSLWEGRNKAQLQLVSFSSDYNGNHAKAIKLKLESKGKDAVAAKIYKQVELAETRLNAKRDLALAPLQKKVDATRAKANAATRRRDQAEHQLMTLVAAGCVDRNSFTLPSEEESE
jgi:hypothetical protein